MVQRRVARQSYEPFDDGRPMPPRDLAMAVAGTAGQRWFSQQGREDADRLLDLARAHGVGVGVAGPVDVLDFGCGCGRIARWVAPEVVAAGGVFYGSDLNRRLIAWCSKHLPGRYLPNRLQPPLDLPTGSVDLVYALSVLTHLTEVTTVGWLAEIRRILRPGGIALLTFLDEQYAERWGPADVLPELRARGFTVLNNALEGSNYMSAWITPAYFTRLAEPAFEVLEFVPSGTDMPKQAVAVLRALP
jgi:SAM-dependent methyltransferase